VRATQDSRGPGLAAQVLVRPADHIVVTTLADETEVDRHVMRSSTLEGRSARYVLLSAETGERQHPGASRSTLTAEAAARYRVRFSTTTGSMPSSGGRSNPSTWP
jgi:hypothetical protein